MCTHACFLYPILFSFGYLRLLLSSRRHGGLHAGLRGLLGASFTSRHPCGALAMYMFYASAFMYQTLCHLCNNEFILIIYSLYTWHVLWYLDNSIVYMRDLILVHIWLLGLCPLYTGCDRIGIKAVSTVGRRPRLELVELRSLSPTLLAETIFYIYSLDSWNFSFLLLGFSLDFVLW